MNAAAEIRLMRRKTARAQTPGPAAAKREPAEEEHLWSSHFNTSFIIFIKRLPTACNSFHTNFDSANLSIISTCNATGIKGIVYSFLGEPFNYHLALMITICKLTKELKDKQNKFKPEPKSHKSHTMYTPCVVEGICVAVTQTTVKQETFTLCQTRTKTN